MEADGSGGEPSWVPDHVRRYILHTVEGISLRELARRSGCNPSTVLRQVRRLESAREDRLVDAALRRFDHHDADTGKLGKDDRMEAGIVNDGEFLREGLRVLKRLSEQGACLAVAEGMETAVVVRDMPDGSTLRTAMVERGIAEAAALRGWVKRNGGGKVARYVISPVGRSALKGLASAEARREAVSCHYIGSLSDEAEPSGGRRYGAPESPMLALARRRDRHGAPYIDSDHIAAGERLREDYELTQTSDCAISDWDAVIAGSAEDAEFHPANQAEAARQRLTAALAHLGPGLGDVALRCCCRLEGFEKIEREMGWTARSGKIVLRIALQQLRFHYDRNAEGWSPLIG